MGKQNSGRVLQALAGKKVLFQGKFEWGVSEYLQGMAEAQQGTIATDLDASVHYLVLPDLSAGKTVQKKALSLNAKGASVQVLDTNAFEALVKVNESQVLALLRGGQACKDILAKVMGEGCRVLVPVNVGTSGGFTMGPAGQTLVISGEKFDGADMAGFWLAMFHFEQCSFNGAKLTGTGYITARKCDFSKAKGGKETTFEDVTGSCFAGAEFPETEFSNIGETDFTGANLEKAEFSAEGLYFGTHKAKAATGCVFARAVLRGAKFQNLVFTAPDFSGADLQDAVCVECSLQEANLRGAKMQNAMLGRCNLSKADLTGADLRGANLGDADLSDARLDGADLADCNLRGAKLGGVNLKKAKNYRPEASASGAAGPALQELDGLAKKARRIAFTFRVAGGQQDGEEVGIDTNGLKYGWGISVPESLGTGFARYPSAKTASDAVIQLANLLGNRKVRFETVEVQSTKSPKGGKELRDLVISGLAEAFVQAVPAAEELAAASKAWREQVREAGAAERQQREEARKAAEAKKAAEKKKIAKTIEKQVGKVTDTATFLRALELRIEKPKIEKATKMLKASGFQLFNDVAETHLLGVVKSQTDPDLVYACRVDAEGNYACCTQNLNICGGLRGSICKHLLVLIIGLVQAGELDPTTIDGWVAKTHNAKPGLDKETMGEIFIRYKGAEAGEVDWRPTQTVPEDYYSL